MLKNYSWNIKSWLGRFLPGRRREESMLAFIWALLAPLQDVVDDFASRAVAWRFRVRYSSQQLVLVSLLNKLFDPVDRRIRVVTVGDLAPEVILYFDGEFDPIDDVVYHDGEPDEAPVVYHESELDGLADYIVYVPSGLSGEEDRILSWIGRYNLADKIFILEYE
jgi:hypothetical protein